MFLITSIRARLCVLYTYEKFVDLIAKRRQQTYDVIVIAAVVVSGTLWKSRSELRLENLL